MDGTDSTEIAPVVTVWSPYEVRVVVPEKFTDDEVGSVGEDGIVLSKALFDGREG